MKKTILCAIAIASSAFFSTSCEKIKEIVNVDVPLTFDYTITIPASPLATDVEIPTVSVMTNVEEIIKDYTKESKIGEIRKVYFSTATVEVLEESRYEDDNLTSISSFVLNMNSTSKSQWTSLVNLDSTPTDPYELELPVNTTIDVKDYFFANDFSFNGTVGMTKSTTKDIKCKMKVKVKINVSI